MTREVLCMAHPVAPTAEEIEAARVRSEAWLPRAPVWRELHHELDRDEHVANVQASFVRAAIRRNLRSALSCLAWLRASFPETTFIAPWIATIQSLDGDDSPALREAGLVDDCAVVERCDGIVLMGPRISSGMDREMRHGTHRVLSGCAWFSLAPTTNDIPEFEVYDLTGYQPEGAAGRNEDRSTFVEWMDGYRMSRTR